MDLVVIFVVIENLVNGYDLEKDIKGLFVDFDIISNCLGNMVEVKNKCLVVVLKGVVGLFFGNFEDN